MKALRNLVSLAALGLFAAGCAQNVGDVNRVQPNYWKKSDFTGEWYIRTTVADVPPAVAFSFIGMTGEMEKVRWEISESHLIAYRSYELRPGMNPEVDQDGKEIGDTDVRRDAEGNPIIDGSYYDKEGYKDAPIAAFPIQSHFDIQRSYNAATGEQSNVIVENASDRPWYEREYMRVNWAVNSVENPMGGVFSNTQYIQESEGGQYAFRMLDEDGNPVIVDPTDERFEDRKGPTYFDFTQRIFTQPATLDYYGRAIPMCWLVGATVDCAGGEVKIRTSVLKVPETRTYEPRVYDDNSQLKFGYFRTERISYDRRRGATDEGQIFLANLHNTWETAYDANGDLIPPARRRPKPIVYALSPNFPQQLIPAAEQVALGWARAYTRAVAAAQGKTPEMVAADFPYEDANGNYLNTGLFQIHYNGNKADMLDEYPQEAYIGDLRYSWIYWVDEPQQASPLGYGPSSPDPETGEIISGMAYVYGASVDTYAQYALDLVDAINGELDVDELTTGEYVRDHIAANRDRTDPRRRALRMGLEEALDKPIEEGGKNLLDPAKAAKLEAIKQFGLETVKESVSSRLSRVKGTPLESMMINDEIRAAVAQKYGDLSLAEADIGPELLEAARPFTLDAGKILQDQKIREDWASRNNIWLADFQDPSIAGLARELASKAWDRETMYQWLRAKIFQGVMEHEVGHTVGLRHNFQGSYDAINYFDPYWELRRENLNYSIQTYGDLFAMSDITRGQEDGKMREFQYSSIMDYGRGFNSDFQGLGKYDEAAILFGYADAVEVFAEAGSGFKNIYFTRYSDGTPVYENRGSLAYDSILDDYHYTAMPYFMGDGNVDTGIARLQNRIVMPWSVVKQMQQEDDPSRFAEVPYLFCSDEWVGAIGSCHRWDEGADMWEQVTNVMNSWRNYYWFTNFRRDRLGWFASDVYGRVLGRYFSMLPNFYQHWLFDQFSSQPDDIQAIYKQIAAFEGFNFLIEVMATPSYGNYNFNAAENAYEFDWSYIQDPGADLYVGRGDGRRTYSRYDYDRGYMYYWYPQEAGHFWEYYGALQALSQSSATVRGVEVDSDFSSYLIPYYLVFDEDLTRVYNGLFIDDWREYAPRYTDLGTTSALGVVQRPAFDYLDMFPAGSEFIDTDPVVKPNMNFTNKFYAVLFGMASFTSSYSLNYPDSHRIFRLGSGETLTPAAGYEVVTFEHGATGIVYAAIHQTGEKPSAAVHLIQEANRLAADPDANPWEVENVVEWMNIQRSLYEVFGRAI